MSVWITIGWCGLGANLGSFPELRLFAIRIGCCKGAIGEKVRTARAQIEITYRHLLRRGAE